MTNDLAYDVADVTRRQREVVIMRHSIDGRPRDITTDALIASLKHPSMGRHDHDR